MRLWRNAGLVKVLLLALLLAIAGVIVKSLAGLLSGALCMVIFTLKSRQQSDLKIHPDG